MLRRKYYTTTVSNIAKIDMQKTNRGIILALAGALLLTPDSLLMRVSLLDGGAMLAWRATLAGAIFVCFGIVRRIFENSKQKKTFRNSNFFALVILQILNASFFSFGISIAPVVVILVSVATVPIIAVILSYFLLGEQAGTKAYVTICIVFLGVILSVFGDFNSRELVEPSTLLGALFGLIVAFSLALNFIIIRKDNSGPFELAFGVGGLTSGLGAFWIFPQAFDLSFLSMIYISFTGIFILPVSFFLLSEASRHTSASNVSIILLLETILGPLWVWMGVSERPSNFAILGGSIVIIALLFFLNGEKRVSSS